MRPVHPQFEPRGARRDPQALLARLEAKLAQSLEEAGPPPLRDAASLLCLGPGAKRARPRLVFAFGEAVGAQEDDLIDAALAAELIHSASLLHDDVIDEGTVRRSRPTANAAFGNHTAVLAGDLLLSLALGALRGRGEAVTNAAVEVVGAMTIAAIREVEARGQTDLSIAKWRAIALGKTGALFGFCGRVPALLVGDPGAAKRLQEVGERLGIAFQMADDLQDLDPTRGKDAGADLRQRNPSLLLVTACARSAAFRRRLAEAWHRADALEEEEVRAFSREVEEVGAPAAVFQRLEAEVEAAVSALGPLRGRPGVIDVEAWARRLLDAARPKERSR